MQSTDQKMRVSSGLPYRLPLSTARAVKMLWNMAKMIKDAGICNPHLSVENSTGFKALVPSLSFHNCSSQATKLRVCLAIFINSASVAGNACQNLLHNTTIFFLAYPPADSFCSNAFGLCNLILKIAESQISHLLCREASRKSVGLVVCPVYVFVTYYRLNNHCV
ncbi:uncharacterized protein LY89DRAFT_499920 [Mollisia scopiformis]|uniref:Uncharacterized protein n=1 Tax=Mollisia scopiformis TaxID=149040 RepID=A0A194XFQ2_MOLSC|nr:uncharacterized protein LY89DRAFT_499920 [Mollisia scopiformis]KUJ18602.1 hypothetical protein LY89DRAFT_499920 [Mollisia scopiformis]